MSRSGHSQERPTFKPLLAMTMQVSIKVHLLMQVYHTSIYVVKYLDGTENTP